MMAATGVCSIIVQAALVRPIVARLGERRTLLTGLIFATHGFAGFGLAPTGTWFLAAVPVFALFGLVNPGLQDLMTARVGKDEQGQLQGANARLMGIAGLLAPIVFTAVLGTLISYGAPQWPGAPGLLEGNR